MASRPRTRAWPRAPLTLLTVVALLTSLMVTAAVADHGPDKLDFHQPQFLGLTAEEVAEEGISNEPDECGVELEPGEVGWAFVVPGNPRTNFFTHVIAGFSGGDQDWSEDNDPGDATLVREQQGNVTLVAFVAGADETLDSIDAWGQQDQNRFVLTHVCVAEPVFVDAVLSGTKFLDGTSTGLEGWEITILDSDQTTVLATETTDANGEWTHTLEDIEEGTSVEVYVCEEQRADWTQTEPDPGDTAGTNATAVDLGALGICWQVTFTAGDTDVQIPGLDFANVENTGAIRIVKDAKHADTSGDTSPNLVATFEVSGPSGTFDVETDANGDACLDGLEPGTYSITETGVPAGYAAPSIPDVDVPSDTIVTCGSGDEVVSNVENTPLTDISWEVDSQHDGATLTVVDCKDGDGNSLPGYPVTVGDGSDTLPDLLPTDPDVTVTCDFTVDP